MSEDHYIARHSAEAFERERLGLLERLADPITFRRLQSLGVREGWRCLEVGAGHGSVARWLARQVGPQGQVVATDLNPRFLEELAEPNITVRHHDILNDELEDAHYDLVHCRFLLMHLSQPQRAAERMAKAVRHGGWLCLEESDYRAARAADSSHPLAAHFTKKMRLAFDVLRTDGIMDPYFGCGVRGLVEGLGFAEVGHDGATWINRGGEIGARFLQNGVRLGAGDLDRYRGAQREGLRSFGAIVSGPVFHVCRPNLLWRLGPTSAVTNHATTTHWFCGNERSGANEMNSTKGCNRDHIRRFREGNIDGVLDDFFPDAILFTPTGSLKGKNKIQKLFQNLLTEFGQPDASDTVHTAIFEGDYAYLIWSGETADNYYEFATDTLIVRGGKIVAQSFAEKITPKR